MEPVAFISTETGDDLIVSFVVQDPNDPMTIESLILLRTPKYEFLLDESERGVHVSFGRNYDEVDPLEEVRFSEHTGTVHIKTRARLYELDVRKVNRQELSSMRKVLRKMNYDRRFKMSGL